MGIVSSLFGGKQVNNLDADSFAQKINEDSNAVVLDVRTQVEYIEARIPNSILIDIYRHDFLTNIERLDKAKNYYVYCRSGSRSYSAAQEMMKMGFQNVYNLEDGIIGWNGEVERG